MYEYQCTRPGCAKKFDRLMRHHTDPNPPCDTCEQPTQRLISPSAFVLKGSGWASDGYAGGAGIDEARGAIDDLCKMKGVSNDKLKRTEAKARGGSGDV